MRSSPSRFLPASIIFRMNVASRVGHLRFTFPTNASSPYIFLEATRPTRLGSPASPNGSWIIYPSGSITIDPTQQEICGRNPERQDEILGPSPAPSFAGYFCARFNTPFASYGVAQNGTITDGAQSGEGAVVGAYARFSGTAPVVDVRVGVSFISVDQARRNLETEIPDGTNLEQTAQAARAQWAEKLGRVKVEGASADQRATFYTGIFHTLQVGLSFTCIVLGWSEVGVLLAGSIRMSKMRTATITPATTTPCTRATHTRATLTG